MMVIPASLSSQNPQKYPWSMVYCYITPLIIVAINSYSISNEPMFHKSPPPLDISTITYHFMVSGNFPSRKYSCTKSFTPVQLWSYHPYLSTTSSHLCMPLLWIFGSSLCPPCRQPPWHDHDIPLPWCLIHYYRRGDKNLDFIWGGGALLELCTLAYYPWKGLRWWSKYPYNGRPIPPF